MAATKIKIDVERNALICGANGGNAYLAPGDKVKWVSARSDLRFTLEFFQLGLENSKEVEVAALHGWPFQDPPEPRGGVVGPTDEFKGTLLNENGLVFKYYVTVGNLRLDPILIVVR